MRSILYLGEVGHDPTRGNGVNHNAVRGKRRGHVGGELDEATFRDVVEAEPARRAECPIERTEAMLIIRPSCCLIIWRAAACERINTPSVDVKITSIPNPGPSARVSPCPPSPASGRCPALLTGASIEPQRRRAVLMMRSTSSATATDAVTVTHSLPTLADFCLQCLELSRVKGSTDSQGPFGGTAERDTPAGLCPR